MQGITHVAFGLFLSLLGVNYFSMNLFLGAILVLGAMFPDIDKGTSLLGRHFKLSWLFKHRGFFHSFYALILFSVIVYILSSLEVAIAFTVGYFSHLVLDALTKAGLSFFMIDKKKRGPFKSGGLFDKLLFFILMLLNTYFTIIMLFNIF